MATLLEKIEASASKRLTLPKGRKPGDELGRYQQFLKVESHRLRMLHRAGGGGRAVCNGRSAMMDVLLTSILEGVEGSLPEEMLDHPPFALVAYGGYGRAELNPLSDVDIMFLHDGRLVARGTPHPYLSALVDVGGLLYTLYDLDLKVGHAVRSIAECVEQANLDMQSKTAMVESRLIYGDAELFEKFQTTMFNKCVKGKETEYIADRLKDQETRRSKYGDSPCMQEPNVKNGCGGLRDYQNLMWMAWFKHHTKTPKELCEANYLTEGEARQLEAGYDFLLRVRNELHYHVNRAVDNMPKSVQPAIAHHLGYTDRSPSLRLEKFMHEFYLNTRNLYLITRTLEQRLALQPKPSAIPTIRKWLKGVEEPSPVVDGFRFEDGFVIHDNPRIFRDQPRRLIRAFVHAQKRGLELHPDLARLIRDELHLVNRSFKADPHVHESFLEILNQRGNVARILHLMHDVDFLGKFIPEFGRLTCLVQHEFYHVYAADEHTLKCLSELDLVWEAKHPPYDRYTEFLLKVEQPFLLYLALLLHDAGKGLEGGEHAQIGGRMAYRVGKRLGLETDDCKALKLLVDNHLTMIQISQNRDLDDPAVIESFARTVVNEDNLRMLTVHTFSDSLGTSKKLWNDFKDSLLSSLFFKTIPILRGDVDLQRAEEKKTDRVAREVRKLTPASFKDDEIDAHFENLPPRYFHIHSPREIAGDLAMAHRFMHLQLHRDNHRALEPVVTWHNEADRGYTTLKVCTWDRAGLFAKIAGSLAASGLNVLSAHIFSREDGIIIDTFFVTEASTGKIASRESKALFEEVLTQALSSRVELDLARTIANRKYTAPLYQALAGDQLEPKCRFDNVTSDDYTILDVVTEDRVGLLYAVSNALTELSFNIAVAKIFTEKGAAIDSFYITDWTGAKVTDEEDQGHLDRKIRMAVRRLDKAVSRARNRKTATK